MRSPGVAVNGENITAIADFDIEPAFYLMQVLIELAAEVGQTAVIVGFESDGVSGGYSKGAIERLLYRV